MAKIKPLGKRVLIQRAKAQTTKGGIILPDASQEKPKEGTVIAVGPGKLGEHGSHEAVCVKVGDRVLFGSYAGTEVKNQDRTEEELLILAEDDILGVLS
jgi:chaperonin GroES